MVRGVPFLYRPRLVDPYLDELLRELPALLIVGPRATGKTTTVARRAATVVRLDREAEAVAFEADPDAALRGLEEPVLLDEWQAVPSVLGAVKRAVDADPRPARFLVTGSVRAELEQMLWPGTGRLVRVPMHGMTVRERIGRADLPSFLDRVAAGAALTVPSDTPDLRGYIDFALASGFPEPALRLSGRMRQAWLDSYVEQLLTHDVDQVEDGPRRDHERVRRYFEAYALTSAGVVDHKTIYEAAGINKLTARSYEDLLRRLLVAEPVPAWASNRLKRLTRQPKRFLADPALIAAALRVAADAIVLDGNLLGRVLETFVVSQLRAELAVSVTRPRLHHLRTEQGRHELDLVAELGGGKLIAIEIKATAAPDSRRDAKHLAWFRDEAGDRFLGGVLFHTGPRLYELSDRIVAAPISALWS